MRDDSDTVNPALDRYQELAELAVRWMRGSGGQAAAAPAASQAASRQRAPLLDQMAQELYRVVLFAVFYLQVCLLGLVPYVGAAALPLQDCLLLAFCQNGILLPAAIYPSPPRAGGSS